jgi:hypothetical protein
MLSASESLFCPLRKIWLKALPEEIVRINLLNHMMQRLGYPLGNICLEKSLSQLPHLATSASLPKRRIDLMVFAKNIHPVHPLYPLLLIECKSIPLTHKVMRQIVGYNQFVAAYFIGVVNQTKELVGYFEPSQGDYIFQNTLPSYEALVKHAQSFLKT